MSRLAHRLSSLESHHRLGISLGCGALAALALNGRVLWRTQLIAGWDAYALCLLALAWTRILTAQPRLVARLVTLQPASRKFIFLFVIAAACASLGAVGFLLGMAKGLSGPRLIGHITLALATVVLSWLVLHTVFTLHYARLFHSGGRGAPGASSDHAGHGLIFPDGNIEPDYLDFAYFAFVIGMTSQVSDVQISCARIRRWALLHGMVSFAFNTAVLALSINIISGLF